jgi:hypothetical protein
MILFKTFSWARETSHPTDSASAISGTETCRVTDYKQSEKFPLWFLIMMPTPIRDEEENIAASTLMTSIPSGNGDQACVGKVVTCL